MKFKISHLVKTYPITFFAVIALFTASAVTAAKGVLLPLAIGEAALSVVLAVAMMACSMAIVAGADDGNYTTVKTWGNTSRRPSGLRKDNH